MKIYVRGSMAKLPGVVYDDFWERIEHSFSRIDNTIEVLGVNNEGCDFQALCNGVAAADLCVFIWEDDSIELAMLMGVRFETTKPMLVCAHRAYELPKTIANLMLAKRQKLILYGSPEEIAAKAGYVIGQIKRREV